MKVQPIKRKKAAFFTKSGSRGEGVRSRVSDRTYVEPVEMSVLHRIEKSRKERSPLKKSSCPRIHFWGCRFPGKLRKEREGVNPTRFGEPFSGPRENVIGERSRGGKKKKS